jgi:hypothetical protein
MRRPKKEADMKFFLSGFLLFFSDTIMVFAQDDQSTELTYFGGNKYQIIATNSNRNTALRMIQEQGQIICQKNSGKDFSTMSQSSSSSKTDEGKITYIITTIFNCQ